MNFYRFIAIIDAIRGRISFFGIKEINCAYGKLANTCSNVVTRLVNCKENGIYNDIKGECVCQGGFYENKTDSTCKRCFGECDDCNGPLASDCAPASSNLL